MKKIIVLFSVIVIACSGSAQFTKASLQASGLTCSLCSKAVKNALEQVSFVQEVSVDIKTQEYAILFKESSNPDFDALKSAVEDAGFSVARLKVTGQFSNLNVEKDKHIMVGGKSFHFLGNGNRLLQGEQTLTLVDKSFVSAKEFKKWSTASRLECVQSGKAGNCCTKEGIAAGARVYHVII